MKRLVTFMLMMVLGLSLTACGDASTDNTTEKSEQTETQAAESPAAENSDTDEQTAETEKEEETQSGEQSKILVAYFSWAENAIQSEDIDAVTSPSVTAPGNVAQLASWVSGETGGDLFSIQVKEPYPADWDGCLERANQEKKDDTHPVLKNAVEQIENYDTIYLGYPNWWYSCPMALLSFFDENDLSGKQVYLFCSHGTGGLASSVKDISAAIPDAEISDHVFDVYEEDAASAKNEIVEWVKATKES